MLTLVVRDGAERPMTSYAQVGVSVRSWHTGDPVDEAVALDPSICQGRYLRSCRHKMWGKGEAQRIWMAATRDGAAHDSAWRGAPRYVPVVPVDLRTTIAWGRNVSHPRARLPSA